MNWRRRAIAIAVGVGIGFATALAVAGAAPAAAGHDPGAEGDLHPTYEPRPTPEPPIYTTRYLFAFTRAIADSTIAPAGQVPLFVLSIPFDVVFLPFGAIAGFFPGGSGDLP